MERRIAPTALNQLVAPPPKSGGRSDAQREGGRAAIFRRKERERAREREVKIRFVLCDAEEQDQPRVGWDGREAGRKGGEEGARDTAAVKNEDVSDL